MALDLTQAKPTPPPARGTGGTRKPSPSGGTADVVEARINRRSDSITELFGIASVALLFAGQQADSQSVATHGPKIAVETAKLAETNEQVAKVADWLGMVGPYAGILTAVLPLGLQIMVNHGRMPAGVMGTVSAETMKAQAMANAARQAADMLEQQNQANREAAEQLARAEAAFTAAQSDTLPLPTAV